MQKEVMFSSATDEWATPQDFFDKYDAVYHFNLDPACTHANAKCEQHYTHAEDGLSKSWGGCRVWLNPPYGRETGKWVRKAYEESLKPDTTVVCLLPARTDTKWFHDYVLPAGELEFIRGRLKFGGQKNAAPFPSMVVIFTSK